MKQILAIFVILSLSFVFVCSADYSKCKVYEVSPADKNQFQTLMRWSEKAGIDFWSYGGVQKPSRVMVTPENQELFQQFLTESAIKYEIEIENVDEVIEKEKAERVRGRARKGKSGSPNFEVYWTFEEMEYSMHQLAKLHPKILKLEVIGQSIEQRNIYAVRISRNEKFGESPTIFVDAGTHAREWVGHASALYLMHQLVENSTIAVELTDGLDWVIVPVVNPDGFVYTWDEDRLWRKNRRYVNHTCTGIDLNRNYPYLWRYSANSCPTENYPGAQAFSEPEIAAMGKYMVSFKDNLRLYLATHSAGNYILWPFGFKFDGYVKNYKEHQKLGERVAKVIRDATGTDYLVGNSADILYTANGCSDDFALAHANANFAYTLELTPGERFRHDFPQDRLYDLVKEMLLMYREFGLFIKERFN